MLQYKTIHESSKLELNLGCHDQNRKVKFGQKQKTRLNIKKLIVICRNVETGFSKALHC